MTTGGGQHPYNRDTYEPPRVPPHVPGSGPADSDEQSNTGFNDYEYEDLQRKLSAIISQDQYHLKPFQSITGTQADYVMIALKERDTQKALTLVERETSDSILTNIAVSLAKNFSYNFFDPKEMLPIMENIYKKLPDTNQTKSGVNELITILRESLSVQRTTPAAHEAHSA